MINKLTLQALSALLLFSLSSITNFVAAASLEIQFLGLDITYDGSTLTTIGDPNPGDPDPLSAVSLYVDGSLAGPNLNAPADDISALLSISVTAISDTGGVGVFAAPGSFDLGLNSGGLNLTLTQATVQYLPTGSVEFVFAGAFATIDGQDLPYGLVIGEPVTLSFSAQIDDGSLASSDGYLTGFTASGTGEVQGTVVPIPATVWLFGSGLLGLVRIARRKTV
jgi:hypothetical protein